MHSKNFCHRDLKPENVLYDEKTKKLKIIDFGTAKKFVRRNKKF
jgi:serine/threonine protein kinase